MFTNTSNAFLLLPTELLAQIFALTTTLDSGATLRSLLLVSRLFHSISVPLKFYCVNLTTSRDIQRFHRELERLEHAPTHSRRIFHLFVSLAQSDIETDTECDTINQIFSILHTAADTLQSLTLIYHNTLFSTSVFGRLFRFSLPVLTELTIHGFYPFPSPVPFNEFPSSDSASCKINTSFMPMLERLHLSGNRNPYGLLQLSSLGECFPSLTHLRVSGLQMAGSFAEEVKIALEEHSACFPNRSNEESEERIPALERSPARLPPNLQSLVVQPGYILLPGRPNAAASVLKKDSWMMGRLKEIGEAAKGRQGVRVTLKDRMQDPATAPVSSGLYKDWLGRMNGAEGCW
ncbi:hypothetical protein GYMLUDRAFT_68901 [Collybiopsis luxurians FD-317 M1]|nr:hypothetical protein GYMLUDRAFT_68901 [Collybiopsis luxurians FD-317 M1]